MPRLNATATTCGYDATDSHESRPLPSYTEDMSAPTFDELQTRVRHLEAALTQALRFDVLNLSSREGDVWVRAPEGDRVMEAPELAQEVGAFNRLLTDAHMAAPAEEGLNAFYRKRNELGVWPTEEARLTSSP